MDLWIEIPKAVTAKNTKTDKPKLTTALAVNAELWGMLPYRLLNKIVKNKAYSNGRYSRLVIWSLTTLLAEVRVTSVNKDHRDGIRLLLLWMIRTIPIKTVSCKGTVLMNPTKGADTPVIANCSKGLCCNICVIVVVILLALKVSLRKTRTLNLYCVKVVLYHWAIKPYSPCTIRYS